MTNQLRNITASKIGHKRNKLSVISTIFSTGINTIPIYNDDIDEMLMNGQNSIKLKLGYSYASNGTDYSLTLH